MADITLSKAVRSNLLNLQSTANQLAKTQERLATGQKVNSALDNPTNFFTASSLNSRAGDLGRLLDAVGNATQTIEAANNGLGAITKLVESAQATARQALQTTGAQTSNKVTGGTDALYNPQKLTSVAGDNSVATGTGTGPIAADSAATPALATIAADSASVTATGVASSTASATSGTVSADATIAAFTGDTTTDGTLLSAAGAGSLANLDSVTFNVNGTDKTVNFITSGAADTSVADTLTIGIDQTVDALATSLNTLFTTDTASGITVARASNAEITFTSDATTNSIKVSDGQNGATLAKLGIELADVAAATDVTSGAVTGDYLLTKNSDIQALAAAGETLSVTTTTGGAETITFGSDTGQVATLAQLQTVADGLTGIDASATATTATFTGATAGEAVAFGAGAAATALGLSASYGAGTGAISTSGVAAGDSLNINVDGTDYTVTFDANSAATQGTNSLTIGVDQSVDDLATALSTTLGADVTVAADATTGALSITSTTAEYIEVSDGGAGTATADLGFGAAGIEVNGGTTTDRAFGKNADLLDLVANGGTLDVKVGSAAASTLTFGTGAGEIASKADLVTALNNLSDVNVTSGSGADALDIDLVNADSTAASTSIVLTGDSAETLTALGLSADDGNPVQSTFEGGNLLSSGAVADGDTLTIKVGESATLTATFGTGTGQISSIADLNTKLQELSGGAASVDSNGEINITSDKAGSIVTVGGSAGALDAFGLTEGDTSNLIDGTNIANGDKLTVQIGTNSALDLTFGNGENQISTLDELETALGNLPGGTAKIDKNTGALSITATAGSDTITIVAKDNADADKDVLAESFGLTNNTSQESDTTDSAKRATLEKQYNELLTQINELSKDSSFNGVNLLAGNDLNVIFNEDGSSTLDIKGVTFDSNGLGLSKLSSGKFQTDGNIDDTLTSLDGAISSLRSQATTFGSQLSVVETRQDFTKKVINTLETGAANLTLADTNEEAANLLALQTRQQLSSTALSLASQADQNVLRLF